MTATPKHYSVDIILPEHWWGNPTYRLHKPMTVQGVTIPALFITDGATVPRFLWFFFPPVCRYFPAAIVHDYLLTQGVSWRKANQVFRETLKALGVKWWRRKLMGASVGLYGLYRETFYEH